MLALGGIVLVYLLVSLATLYQWHVTAMYPIAGDEPNYLVMTRGLLVHHTLEQTLPYRDAFSQSLFWAWGTPDAIPSPANSQTVLGPNGLFNEHNFGLPLLLVVPYAIGGVLGAKMFMLLIGALVIGMFWKIAGVFTPSLIIRTIAVAGVSTALPLLPNADQIYPDIPAGLLTLVGLYWVLTINKKRPLWRELAMAVAVAYLPLLQVKFSATLAVLGIALVIGLYRRQRRLSQTFVVVIPVAVFMAVLVGFNVYAYGNFSGPYESGAVEFSPHSLMVFFGLIVDQNQGILFQGPLILVGLFAIGLMFAARKWFSLVWVAATLSLLVPNALHVNWYGGASFTGRFEWSGAVVFGVVTVFGLIRLASGSTGGRAVAVAVLALGVGYRAVLWLMYTFTDVQIYNQAGNGQAFLQNYTLYFFPLEQWLPAMYNVAWAYTYPPNYIWVALCAGLVVTGFLVGARRLRLGRLVPVVVSVAAVAVIVAGGFLNPPPNAPLNYAAGSALGLESGSVTPAGGVLVAQADGDKAGPVTTGPYMQARRGTYKLMITYSSTAPANVTVGSWSAQLLRGTPLATETLSGTDGAVRTSTIYIHIDNRVPEALYAPTSWNGTADVTILNLQIALQPEQ